MSSVSVWAGDYFPLITTPQWSEILSTTDIFGEPQEPHSRNLRGANGTLPIIRGFDGNVFVLERSANNDVDMTYGLPLTDAYFDYTLDENGLTYHGADYIRYDSLEGLAADVFYVTRQRVERLIDGQPAGSGVRTTPRTANIGEVTSYNYLSTVVIDTPRPVLERWNGDYGLPVPDRVISTSVNRIEVTTVFAGYASVPNLFPAANPIIITPEFKALVRVSRTRYLHSQTTVETFGENPRVDVYTDVRPPDSTVVEWFVDGIGLIHSVTAEADYFQEILQEPVFDDGDQIIGTRSLMDILGFVDGESLRVSGGELGQAQDTLPNGNPVELFGAVATPHPPGDLGWWKASELRFSNWYDNATLKDWIHIPAAYTFGLSPRMWVYHRRLGFLNVSGSTDASLWIFKPSSGWWWTNHSIFPNAFNASTATWATLQ